MSTYRVTFSPNGLDPFTFPASDFDSAKYLANLLSIFDLGRVSDEELQQETPESQQMIKNYIAYRKKHNINHSSKIAFSVCTIDKIDDSGVWWIVSENLDEEFDTGYLLAFDSLEFLEDMYEPNF